VLQGGLIGRLAQRFGEVRLLLCGLVLIAAGLVLLALCRGIPLLAIAVSALALGMGLTQPSLNSLISRRAGRDEQGGVLGVTQSVGSLARVLGPPVAGYLFADLGHPIPFVGGAVLVVLAFVLALNLFRGLGATAVVEPEPPSDPAG
jgi:DHA1 family tetracycline resistance protein-like MFS transporter